MAGVLQDNGKKDARTGPRDRLQGNVSATDYYFKLRLSFSPPRSVSVSSAKTRTVSESSLQSSTYSATDNSL